jgi:NitT/TauT family transport system permease protein
VVPDEGRGRQRRQEGLGHVITNGIAISSPRVRVRPESVRPRFSNTIGFVSVVFGLAAWEAAGHLIAAPFLPPLSAVLRAGWIMAAGGELHAALLASLGSLMIGFTAAAVVGLSVGTLMGRFRTVESLIDPLLDPLMAAPALIYVPVFFAIFGVSRLSQVAVIFVYAVFVIAATTFAAVRSVDKSLVEMAQSFGANGWQLFRFVVLPGTRPLVMTGLRVGVARAVKGMINGEMFITLSGLGAIVRQRGSRFEADYVLAIVLVIVVVAVGLTVAVNRFENRAVVARTDQWNLE